MDFKEKYKMPPDWNLTHFLRKDLGVKKVDIKEQKLAIKVIMEAPADLTLLMMNSLGLIRTKIHDCYGIDTYDTQVNIEFFGEEMESFVRITIKADLD